MSFSEVLVFFFFFFFFNRHKIERDRRTRPTNEKQNPTCLFLKESRGPSKRSHTALSNIQEEEGKKNTQPP